VADAAHAPHLATPPGPSSIKFNIPVTSFIHAVPPARVRLASLFVAIAAAVGLQLHSTAALARPTNSAAALAPSATSPAAAKIAVDLQGANAAATSPEDRAGSTTRSTTRKSR
jgi:hypothetical protein